MYKSCNIPKIEFKSQFGVYTVCTFNKDPLLKGDFYSSIKVFSIIWCLLEEKALTYYLRSGFLETGLILACKGNERGP